MVAPVYQRVEGTDREVDHARGVIHRQRHEHTVIAERLLVVCARRQVGRERLRDHEDARAAVDQGLIAYVARVNSREHAVRVDFKRLSGSRQRIVRLSIDPKGEPARRGEYSLSLQ